MTLTIDLAPETAEQLRVLAQAQGKDLNAFAVALLQEAARGQKPGDAEPLPASPAEAVAYWQRNGLLGGYGDPALDSPELARELRRQAQTRQW